jgi:hypothetical protein
MNEYNFNLGDILQEWNQKYNGASDMVFLRVITKFTSIWEKNTDQYLDLDKKEHASIGEILKSHLMVEFYLNELLKHIVGSNYITDIILETTFYKKIKALKKFFKNDNVMTHILDCIIELNTIRNKYSHNIQYIVTKNDTLRILKYLHKEHVEIKNEEELIKLIKEFTSTMCTIIPIYYGETNLAFICEVNKIKDKTWEEIYNN